MTTYKPKQRDLPLNGAAWGRLRCVVLADEPLCRHCALDGIVRAAEHVDHINNDGNNNERDNLQSLCHRCHSKKTQQDIHGVKHGVDSNGFPLDPSHHWNK